MTGPRPLDLPGFEAGAGGLFFMGCSCSDIHGPAQNPHRGHGLGEFSQRTGQRTMVFQKLALRLPLAHQWLLELAPALVGILANQDVNWGRAFGRFRAHFWNACAYRHANGNCLRFPPS